MSINHFHILLIKWACCFQFCSNTCLVPSVDYVCWGGRDRPCEWVHLTACISNYHLALLHEIWKRRRNCTLYINFLINTNLYHLINVLYIYFKNIINFKLIIKKFIWSIKYYKFISIKRSIVFFFPKKDYTFFFCCGSGVHTDQSAFLPFGFVGMPMFINILIRWGEN